MENYILGNILEEPFRLSEQTPEGRVYCYNVSKFDLNQHFVDEADAPEDEGQTEEELLDYYQQICAQEL